ncbi:MAG TPA: cupredoxin family copper-binding protein [Tepidisphaeraceae bacterium]|nr:cupredoxin family copper-binding protein [Tepidisphaeraceae bacterium]
MRWRTLKICVVLGMELIAGVLAVGCHERSGTGGASATGSASATPAAAETRAAGQPSATSPVGIDNFSFIPAEITVPAGTTVTWVNHDDVPHTVTSTDKRFASSPALDTDGRFSQTFTTPGTYAYYCAVHPHMTGKVIVK